MANVVVQLGSLTFNGSADGNGTYWLLSVLDGWHGVNVRQTWHPKLGASGAVLGESNLDVREVMLSGTVVATSQANAWTAANSLQSVLEGSVTTPISLTVQEPSGSKTLSVVMSAPLRTSWVKDRVFQFQITVTAGNPVKA